MYFVPERPFVLSPFAELLNLNNKLRSVTHELNSTNELVSVIYITINDNIPCDYCFKLLK